MSHKEPRPLHHTFLNDPNCTTNRAITRRATRRTLAFRVIKRKVKEYTLRQHRITCVANFMTMSMNRKKQSDTIT